MQETPVSGTDSTDRCNATTDVSIPNTLDVQQKRETSKGKKTGTKRAGSGTNASSVKRDPLPQFLVTDLASLTFQIDESTYQADDTEHVDEWVKFISQYATLPSGLDWTDLEERVHFLNMLYAYRVSRGKPFPLETTEKN